MTPCSYARLTVLEDTAVRVNCTVVGAGDAAVKLPAKELFVCVRARDIHREDMAPCQHSTHTRHTQDRHAPCPHSASRWPAKRKGYWANIFNPIKLVWGMSPVKVHAYPFTSARCILIHYIRIYHTRTPLLAFAAPASFAAPPPSAMARTGKARRVKHARAYGISACVAPRVCTRGVGSCVCVCVCLRACVRAICKSVQCVHAQHTRISHTCVHLHRACVHMLCMHRVQAHATCCRATMPYLALWPV